MEPRLCRVAANALPDLRLRAIFPPGQRSGKTHPRQETWPRPAQAQRRRARTAGAEPRLCRVAANALPDLRLRAICHPGQRSGKTYPAAGNLA
ncbi:hypothetical protein C4Z29_025660 [Klebsiella quasipneumoniae subsp. quasipneumoniae]|nr:hypothetical protein C4Z29_025660 [Klebsiella quasipneumoniae subsp. quasipneumoniae]